MSETKQVKKYRSKPPLHGVSTFVGLRV